MVAWLDGTPPKACSPAEALIQKPEALQLFLKCRRENAESCCSPSLASAGREQSRDDEALLEARQNVPKHQAIACRFGVEPRVGQRPFRKVTRHDGRIGQPAEPHNGTSID